MQCSDKCIPVLISRRIWQTNYENLSNLPLQISTGMHLSEHCMLMFYYKSRMSFTKHWLYCNKTEVLLCCGEDNARCPCKISKKLWIIGEGHATVMPTLFYETPTCLTSRWMGKIRWTNRRRASYRNAHFVFWNSNLPHQLMNG